MLLTLLFVSLLVFVVVRVLPGDPALIMLGIEASPDAVAKMTPKQVDALTDPQLARGLSLVTAITSPGS